jgi:hypothetical protein
MARDSSLVDSLMRDPSIRDTFKPVELAGSENRLL